RHVRTPEQGLPPGAEGGEEQKEAQPDRARNDDREAGRGPLLVLELAAPLDVVAGRELDLLRDPAARLVDEADEVAPGHVRAHDGEALAALAGHRDDAVEPGQLRDRLDRREPLAVDVQR